jgi:hypothetical protein
MNVPNQPGEGNEFCQVFSTPAKMPGLGSPGNPDGPRELSGSGSAAAYRRNQHHLIAGVQLSVIGRIRRIDRNHQRRQVAERGVLFQEGFPQVSDGIAVAYDFGDASCDVAGDSKSFNSNCHGVLQATNLCRVCLGVEKFEIGKIEIGGSPLKSLLPILPPGHKFPVSIFQFRVLSTNPMWPGAVSCGKIQARVQASPPTPHQRRGGKYCSLSFGEGRGGTPHAATMQIFPCL